MSRIVYLAFPAGRVAGGHKMILRHVQTLRELGFDAVLWLNQAGPGFDRFPPERRPVFITPGRICGETVARLYPGAQVEVVRSFADERVFHPREPRRLQVALTPRKRPAEAQIIRNMFVRALPRHAAIPWVELNEATEAQVAEAFVLRDLGAVPLPEPHGSGADDARGGHGFGRRLRGFPRRGRS